MAPKSFLSLRGQNLESVHLRGRTSLDAEEDAGGETAL